MVEWISTHEPESVGVGVLRWIFESFPTERYIDVLILAGALTVPIYLAILMVAYYGRDKE